MAGHNRFEKLVHLVRVVAVIVCAARVSPLSLAGDTVVFWWGEKVTPTVAQQGGSFGKSVSILEDRCAIGAPSRFPENDEGRVKTLERTASGWQYPVEWGDYGPGDGFGVSVDLSQFLSKDWCLAGAFTAPDYCGIGGGGSASMYRHEFGVWPLQNRPTNNAIICANGIVGFAASVADDGEFGALGAPTNAENGTAAGAVYIIEHYLFDDNWYITPEWDGGGRVWYGENPYDYFGVSVAAYHWCVVVGAPGADKAYMFDFDPGDDSFHAGEILDATEVGIDLEFFGRDVAIEKRIVVVGAPGYFSGNPGSAVVYEYDGADWNSTDVLSAAAPDADDFFGFAVAVTDEPNDMIVVGAYGADVNGAPNAGSMFLFERGEVGWALTRTFHAPDDDAEDQFGWSIDLDECAIIVGAPSDDECDTDAGAAYIFEKHITRWGAQLLTPEERSIIESFSGFPFRIGTGSKQMPTGELGAVVWQLEDRQWTMEILPDYGPFESRAYDGTVLTDVAAIVVGSALDATGAATASEWVKANGTWQMIPLPLPAGAVEAAALTLLVDSDTTLIGGTSTDIDGEEQATLWRELAPGTWQSLVLPDLPGGSQSMIESIALLEDDRAFAVGRGLDDEGRIRPVRWRQEAEGFSAVSLPPLQGSTPEGAAHEVVVFAGDRLRITGESSGEDGQPRAVQWSKATGTPWQIEELQGLNALPRSTAFGTLEASVPGLITGSASIAGSEQRAVIWEPGFSGGTVIDLHAAAGMPDLLLEHAVGMNRRFEIAVNARVYTGSEYEQRAVILMPAESDCPADLDGDGRVGIGDLLTILGAWGSPEGDVTGDGTTDVADLLAVLAAWGPC